LAATSPREAVTGVFSVAKRLCAFCRNERIVCLLARLSGTRRARGSTKDASVEY